MSPRVSQRLSAHTSRRFLRAHPQSKHCDLRHNLRSVSACDLHRDSVAKISFSPVVQTSVSALHTIHGQILPSSLIFLSPHASPCESASLRPWFSASAYTSKPRQRMRLVREVSSLCQPRVSQTLSADRTHESVQPPREFVRVAPCVLGRDVMKGSVNAPLQDGPNGLNAVRAGRTSRIFASGVIDTLVTEKQSIKAGERAVIVGVKLGADFNVFVNRFRDGFYGALFQRGKQRASATFAHSKHGSFSDRPTACAEFLVLMLVRFLATDETFVKLYDAFEFFDTLRRAAGFAQTMQHEPCGLLRDADFLRQLQRRDAFACCHEQIHCVEPFLQRNFAALKDRAGADREIKIAASVATVEAGAGTLRDALTAFAIRATDPVRPQARLQVEPRRFLVGEGLEKLEGGDGRFAHLRVQPLPAGIHALVIFLALVVCIYIAFRFDIFSNRIGNALIPPKTQSVCMPRRRHLKSLQNCATLVVFEIICLPLHLVVNATKKFIGNVVAATAALFVFLFPKIDQFSISHGVNRFALCNEFFDCHNVLHAHNVDESRKLVKNYSRLQINHLGTHVYNSLILGDANLLGKLKTADALPGRHKQVHGVQPLLERHFRPLENSSCPDGEIEVAASIAAIKASPLARGDAFSALAVWATDSIRPEPRFQVQTCGLFIREGLKELECANCGFGHLTALPEETIHSVSCYRFAISDTTTASDYLDGLTTRRILFTPTSVTVPQSFLREVPRIQSGYALHALQIDGGYLPSTIIREHAKTPNPSVLIHPISVTHEYAFDNDAHNFADYRSKGVHAVYKELAGCNRAITNVFHGLPPLCFGDSLDNASLQLAQVFRM